MPLVLLHHTLVTGMVWATPTPTAQLELSTPALYSRPKELALKKGARSKELILSLCSMGPCICIWPNLWPSQSSRNETRLCCDHSCAVPSREFCIEVIFLRHFNQRHYQKEIFKNWVPWNMTMTIQSQHFSIERHKSNMALRNSTQLSREGKASSRSCGR